MLSAIIAEQNTSFTNASLLFLASGIAIHRSICSYQILIQKGYYKIMRTYRYKTALLIDDSEIDNLIHTQLIKSISLAEQIVIKYSAIDALEYIMHSITRSLSLPDIIFLDINMPLMDGFDFLDKLETIPSDRCIWNATKIVMLSSTIDINEMIRIQEHPYIHTFICKPLTPLALLQLL